MGGIPRAQIDAAVDKLTNEYDLQMQAAPTIEITAQNLGEVRVCVMSKLHPATKNNECFYSSYFNAVPGFELNSSVLWLMRDLISSSKERRSWPSRS